MAIVIAIAFPVYFETNRIVNTSVNIASGSGSSTNPDCVNTRSCFYPNPLVISVDDTVTWTNKDSLSHTVTSGTFNADNVGALFDSKVMKSGQTFKFTFTKIGIYDYFCVLHPWMQGQIIVK